MLSVLLWGLVFAGSLAILTACSIAALGLGAYLFERSDVE